MRITTKNTSPCPVCSEYEIVPLCKSNGYEVLRCVTCASDFVSPMPDETALKAYYDDGNSYFQSESQGSYADYDLETEGVLSLFNDFLLTIPNVSEKKVLDVGCAFGTHLAMARQQGWGEAWGVELSSYAREMALSRHGDKIHVVENIASLPKIEFDLIVILDVLEHLPDPYAFFIELFSHGVIGKKTQIVITTPNARSADAITNPASWAYRYPPAHLVYFSAYSLKLLLLNLGGIDVVVQGIHAANIDVFNDYPDESSALNPNFKNCSGLIAIVQGFDTFLHEWSNVTSATTPAEIVDLHQKIFTRQKQIARKYTFALQEQALEIQHLKATIKEMEDNISKIYQSKWHQLGLALKIRPMTFNNLVQICQLVGKLIIG